MLTFRFPSSGRTCGGATRRDFLRVGSLGTGALALPELLRARAEARAGGLPVKDTAVVMLWLSGGPTHIETFDPKMDAPAEFRSTVGDVATRVPGVYIGGLFPRMAQLAHHMVFVRSFAHTNAGHGGGTHWVMTGYDHPPADQNVEPIRPSLGSITARYRGTTHPVTGMPTYVRLGRNGIYDAAAGPAFLGAAFSPFDTGGQAQSNMSLTIEAPRLSERRQILKTFDQVQRSVDATGLMTGMDHFEGQAFSLILGRAKEAFDLSREDPRIRELYGQGLGEHFLAARRLCETGCGFVTINFGGWDMHGGIVNGLRNLCPPVDRAVSAFVEDCTQRSLSDRVLLVITGEFGRTPKVNTGAGRDHWPQLSTLALAGGGLRMGQMIGESDAKAVYPKSAPISPQDLMATIFHVLGIDLHVQFTNQFGRPVYMVEHGAPIAGLV